MKRFWVTDGMTLGRAVLIGLVLSGLIIAIQALS